MIKLSILIPSVHTRRNTFLPKIQDEIFRQIDALPAPEQPKVEVLVLTDNKRVMLGEKRNIMVNMSQGEYYVFVDDDDRIAQTYVSDLLEATETGADVITFVAEVTINGGKPKPCIYSKDFTEDHNTASAYHRLPNHICAVKKSIGVRASFPNIRYGEDSAYSKLLKPMLKSQHHIDKVLYHYDFNAETTETQEHLRSERRIVRDYLPPIVDVVFISNGSDTGMRRMTQEAINSCLSGANGLAINIIVVEQNTEASYSGCKTVHVTTPFNYNGRANQGARLGRAPWIMVCNNDLSFGDGWLHNLLAAGHDVVSPKCPRDPRQREITENTTGTTNGKHFSGWAFMIRRELWTRIGGFDEDVTFWFSDDCTIEQVVKAGTEPMIVPASMVHHYGSTTLKSLDPGKMDDFTWGQVDIFNTKYNRDKFSEHPEYIRWKARK